MKDILNLEKLRRKHTEWRQRHENFKGITEYTTEELSKHLDEVMHACKKPND